MKTDRSRYRLILAAVLMLCFGKPENAMSNASKNGFQPVIKPCPAPCSAMLLRNFPTKNELHI